MTDTPLRELLTDLTRDPAAQARFEADPGGWLASHGHDLSDDLVAEAVVSVSAVLPVEVAEHLAPFTIAVSPVPSVDDTSVDEIDGLALLGTAPAVSTDDGAAMERADGDGSVDVGEQFGAGATVTDADIAASSVDSFDDVDAPFSAGVDTASPDVVDELAPVDGDGGFGLDLGSEVADTIETIGDDPADLDGIE